jgi:hypothetical protein
MFVRSLKVMPESAGGKLGRKGKKQIAKQEAIELRLEVWAIKDQTKTAHRNWFSANQDNAMSICPQANANSVDNSPCIVICDTRSWELIDFNGLYFPPATRQRYQQCIS